MRFDLAQMPAYRLIAWLIEWPQFSVCLLVAAAMLSAMGVVYSAHETRRMYSELQSLESRQDFLDSEYEKLLLEQGAWADYTRVDQISRKDLGMGSPATKDIVVVKR